MTKKVKLNYIEIQNYMNKKKVKDKANVKYLKILNVRMNS